MTACFEAEGIPHGAYVMWLLLSASLHQEYSAVGIRLQTYGRDPHGIPWQGYLSHD